MGIMTPQTNEKEGQPNSASPPLFIDNLLISCPLQPPAAPASHTCPASDRSPTGHAAWSQELRKRVVPAAGTPAGPSPPDPSAPHKSARSGSDTCPYCRPPRHESAGSAS